MTTFQIFNADADVDKDEPHTVEASSVRDAIKAYYRDVLKSCSPKIIISAYYYKGPELQFAVKDENGRLYSIYFDPRKEGE